MSMHSAQSTETNPPVFVVRRTNGHHACKGEPVSYRGFASPHLGWPNLVEHPFPVSGGILQDLDRKSIYGETVSTGARKLTAADALEAARLRDALHGSQDLDDRDAYLLADDALEEFLSEAYDRSERVRVTEASH